MKDTFDRSLSYAQSLGYSSIAEAMKYIDPYVFRTNAKKYVPQKNNFKPIKFDDRYLIYNDGRVYSNIYKRFLKGKKEDGHLLYELGKDNKYMASRLVYFHFCKHDKVRISDLLHISYKDKDKTNLYFENLEEMSKSDVMKKYKIRSKNGGMKSKIPSSEIDFVKTLLNKGFSQNKIGILYDVSAMSVNRFIKKHRIIW